MLPWIVKAVNASNSLYPKSQKNTSLKIASIAYLADWRELCIFFTYIKSCKNTSCFL